MQSVQCTRMHGFMKALSSHKIQPKWFILEKHSKQTRMYLYLGKIK